MLERSKKSALPPPLFDLEVVDLVDTLQAGLVFADTPRNALEHPCEGLFLLLITLQHLL